MSPILEGFASFDVQVGNDIVIHGIKGGTGPPLLLIHGFPQTHLIWHQITPELSDEYTLILIDLRGYGASSKPPPSDTHEAYSKKSMARDCAEVMSFLNFKQFSVVGHDRGGRVAHKLAVDYPDRVQKCMVLDIAPTLSMFEKTSQEFATAYWHWFFLIQPHPFPEMLILTNHMIFAQRFFAVEDGKAPFIEPMALTEYVAQLQVKDGVAGMCEDYRAAATIDLEHAKEDLEEGRKVKCDLRVLWAKNGVVEKCFDALEEWKAVCDGEVSGEAVGNGHYIPEEAPDALIDHIREFFGEGEENES